MKERDNQEKSNSSFLDIPIFRHKEPRLTQTPANYGPLEKYAAGRKKTGIVIAQKI